MAREATLSVSLTNQLRDYVRSKVDSGQFESASEVIRQSLRKMQEEDHFDWLDVRAKVKEARRAIAKGEVVNGPRFMRDKIRSLSSSPANRKACAKRK